MRAAIMNFVISHRQTSQSDSNPVILLRNHCTSKLLQGAPQQQIQLMHNTAGFKCPGWTNQGNSAAGNVQFYTGEVNKMGLFIFNWFYSTVKSFLKIQTLFFRINWILYTFKIFWLWMLYLQCQLKLLHAYYTFI